MKEMPFTIASFDNFLKEKKLMASKCKECSALWLPPRPICPTCKSHEMEWVELSGRGKLVAFTVIGVGPIPMIDAGYNRDNPYCAGIVEVEEGPRISAQILGVDVAHPENIKIGTPLTADFVERGSWHFVEELAKMRKMYLAFKV
ncbi:MAG: Zn-ribbon domain-containing OB-fold protein [Deltaproteobacteria bacterium]|nr:MAG: Zn-ribbon domain-containing OB-fold protein [Deltaproteobacteria bacterium]